MGEVLKEFDTVLNYDNIAIVVLFIVMLLQWWFISKLLNILFSLKETVQSVTLAINTLNERLHR